MARRAGAFRNISRRGKRQAGHAAVEAALMAPWIFLLFAMVFDLGFYSYAVIATQNAARSGVMFTSGSGDATDAAGAFLIARRELQGMPNVSSTTTMASSKGTISTSQPIFVVATALTDENGTASNKAHVEVTYKSPNFFLLPGLTNILTLTRISEARVRAN
ncbi:MAG: pilus assembly protein [Acidobacteria bacterium]|nr:pilus assembly protein [Acidobacteriota bacterium]